MKVTKTLEGTKLTVAVEGRLDTLAAPELEEALAPELDQIKTLIFDMADLEYMSSAGLRVLVNASQTIENAAGKMSIVNVNEGVREKRIGIVDTI
ncbi:MAG: STAS domain-containing protein, partial [Clostridia bacterium]|nr:STAS domain-containing protein [Clostridia bacterium]